MKRLRVCSRSGRGAFPYTVLLDPSTFGDAALLDVGTTSGMVAAGTTLASASAHADQGDVSTLAAAKTYTDQHSGGGGGSGGFINDDPVGAGIVVLTAAATWTVLPAVSKAIPCATGHRVLWAPSFLRGGTAFTLDAAILKADGSVSRYVSTGTSSPGAEGYAPFCNNPAYKGIAGLRMFVIRAEEIDPDGNVTIAAAYIAPSIDPGDTSNHLYLGGGYDGYWLMWDVDA
ncbi:hypothetical protein [Streptomyces sp. NBC_01190]|uniref:hypothetical protein n=1 Tax=Streptomyces sp. NBC_01190 TaxID=2903767 RepID=UPI0038637BBA|nr:hypothetical protein OG519_09270 [Streptomyces sp. NBC_01190]